MYRYGALTGGVPGAEPLPFMGFPLLEPELHPSYVLQSVVLTNAQSKYSSDEICSRNTITEVISRTVLKGLYKNNINSQVSKGENHFLFNNCR
jgi:hypothetical protein